MANINWITFNTPRHPAEIAVDLQEIIARRFGDPTMLKYRGAGYWDYDSPSHGGFGLSIKTEGNHRITFKPGGTLRSDYAEFVIRTELGVLYNATCGGEFDEEAEWAPDPAKYPTFESYQRKFA
jgi:hypothetical protein